jgi:SAM-dependent methyltransferase
LLTDGNTVPLPDASFDVIFSIHVIEHVVSPSLYLSEVARLLKPGGVVLLSCPNRIWPYEPHAQLPFLPYLPISIAKALCRRRSQSERIPEGIRRQYHTGTLLNHYFSFLGLRRLCRRAGLEFIEANPTGLFIAVPEVSFGAWGKDHQRFENTFNALNRWLIRDRISPYVRAHPQSHLAHWLALTLNWEIGGVLRKTN